MNKIKNHLKRITVLCLFLIFFCHASYGADTEITAQGVADMHSVSQATARDMALEDAMRKAVEQAVGTLINSESVVENYTLLSDRIYSRSKGYIRSYRILDEGKDDGLYTVEILAKVGLDNIKGDLEAINVLLSRSHNPRVMVIIGESVAGEKLKIYEGLSITETAMIDQFLTKSFKVIDAEMVKKTIERDQLLCALEGDTALAAKIGLQYNAEIVIMGKATADPSENIMETNIRSIHTNISVKAIRSDNAEIIATESASCTKAHVNESIGAHKAFQESGKKLADALMKKILEKLRKDTDLATVELTISGISSFSQLVGLENAIKQNARGIKDIHRRSYTSGVAKLELKLREDTQAFAEKLLAIKTGNILIEVTGVTQNKIDAKIKE